MNSVPAFSLKDVSGNEREFSGGNQSLVCFIKEDCPTCREVMPLLSEIESLLNDQLEIHILGQTKDGNALLEREFSPSFSIVDDSDLKVSFETDIETVPTMIWSDGSAKQREVVGFDRNEWKDLIEELSLIHI